MAFGVPLVTALAVGTSVGAAALAGMSAIQQGKYQAAVARNNALLAEQNAAQESEAAQISARRMDIENAQARAAALAGQAASGFDILGRSQTRTRAMMRRVGAQESQDIRRAGTNTARRLMQDAANFRAEARQAKTQGLLSGVGSFMSGIGSAANQLGVTRSLATSRTRMGGRRPWDTTPNWYGRG